MTSNIENYSITEIWTKTLFYLLLKKYAFINLTKIHTIMKTKLYQVNIITNDNNYDEGNIHTSFVTATSRLHAIKIALSNIANGHINNINVKKICNTDDILIK